MLKHLLLLLFIFPLCSHAKWAPLNLKEAVCSSDYIIEGTIISFNEDYLAVDFIKEPRKTFYRIAKLKVTNVVKGDYKQQNFLFLTPEQKKSTGKFDHMLIRRSLNQSGLWFFKGRDYFSGQWLEYPHPSLPIKPQQLAEVQKLREKC